MALTEKQLDEIFAAPGNLADFDGQTVTLTGVEWREGTYGEYAVVDLTDEKGEEAQVSGSWKAILPRLKKIEELDGFPLEVRIETYATKFSNDGVKMTRPE